MTYIKKTSKEKQASVLMFQGTSSSVGKSLMVAAFCRIFQNQGIRVAPFKSQNMALNAAVTPDGGEIGRAQAVQARAAGIPPSVFMNPILLKPEGHSHSQIILQGKSQGSMSAAAYYKNKRKFTGVIEDSLNHLRSQYDVVLIEGAGSPAEINLQEQDVVNMYIARMANAPVLLVGDIDRGGVFASLFGTLALLEKEDRVRIQGFLINKFRGDQSLLKSGLDFLTKKTGIDVLGVIPFLSNMKIPEEDSVALDQKMNLRRAKKDEIEINVIRFPGISNYDDFHPLEYTAGTRLRYTERPEEIRGSDLIILPGTKRSIEDLRWLKEKGFTERLKEYVREGGLLLGVCGGCQMLGNRIFDNLGVETTVGTEESGLGFLNFNVSFKKEKRTRQVTAKKGKECFLTHFLDSEKEIKGYEIHSGKIQRNEKDLEAFRIFSPGEKERPDGGIHKTGNIVGTMVHGIFENKDLKDSLIAHLKNKKKIVPNKNEKNSDLSEDPYEVLAKAVENAVDIEKIKKIIFRS